MRVRIRLQRGPKVRRKVRKNRHLALASAALLTPGALVAFMLGVWRLGADLGFARSFFIQVGIFSHWQVWLAISFAVQFCSVILNRYGNPELEIPELEIGPPEGKAPKRVPSLAK